MGTEHVGCSFSVEFTQTPCANSSQEFLKHYEACLDIYAAGLRYAEQWLGSDHAASIALRDAYTKAIEVATLSQLPLSISQTSYLPCFSSCYLPRRVAYFHPWD